MKKIKNKKLFFIIPIFFLFSSFNIFKVNFTYASLSSFTGGIEVTGSPTWDSLDSDPTDTLIRTHDTIEYRYQYVIDSAGTGESNIVATLPQDGTLGSVLKWKLVPDICQNIVSTPPTAQHSGISADGQILTCYLGDITNAQIQTVDFRAQVLGSVPNNTVLAPPTAQFIGGSETVTATNNPDTQVGGMVDLTVKAELRWDVEVNSALRANHYLVLGSGPSGEDGVITHYRLGVKLNGSKKGAEAIQNIQIIDDISGLPTGTRLLTWPATNTKVNEPTGCKNVDSSDDYISSGYDQINDTGPNNSILNYAVANGGSCNASQSGGADTSVTVNISNINASLSRFPTVKNSTNTPIINPLNEDDPTNQYYVSNKIVYLWTPLSSWVPNATTSTINKITTSAVSISGQTNQDVGNIVPDGDNRISSSLIRRAGFSSGITYYSAGTSAGYVKQDYSITGDNNVTSVGLNEKYGLRSIISNSGTEPLNNLSLCQKIDNSRQRIFDLKAAIDAGENVSFGQYVRDDGIIIYKVRKSDLATSSVSNFEADVDFGVLNDTWVTQNNANDRYSVPLQGTSEQTTDDCNNPGITWYEKLSDVPDLQKVRYVRLGSEPSYVLESDNQLFMYFGLQARSTFAFDVHDIWRDNSTSSNLAGENTLNSFAPAQGLANAKEVATGTSLTTAYASDTVRISPVTFPQITQTSSTHPINNGSVLNGSLVSYNLQANVNMTGITTEPIDITITDVLPPHLSFKPNSVTFGGNPVNDPTIQNNTPASGYTTLTFSINNYSPNLGIPGAVLGNLPLLKFDALVDLASPDGTRLLTSTTIQADYNNYPSATYNQTTGSFEKTSGEHVGFAQYSNYTLEVDTLPGFQINKTSDSDQTEINSYFSYTLSYIANGDAVENARLIDILPYNSDSRGSDFSGTTKLTNLEATDPEAILYYTKNNPTNIDSDPYSADHTHNLTGTGTNSNLETNWCQTNQFGTTSCPSDIQESTAFLIVTSPTIEPAENYTVSVDLISSNNVLGDKYVNNFTANAPNLGASLTSPNAEVEVLPASLSGNIYLDNNNNGVFDSTNPKPETGISNIPIYIECLSANCIIGTKYSTYTDTNGHYNFIANSDQIRLGEDPTISPIPSFYGLASGTWQVKEISQPTNYSDGLETAGIYGGSTTTNEQITNIIIPIGGSATNYNFGERMLGSLSGNIWEDENNNQTKDTGELNLANITINLTGNIIGGGTVSLTQTTNNNGNYSFTNQPLGDYTITVNPASLPISNKIATYDFDGIGTLNTGVTTLSEGSLSYTIANFGYAKSTLALEKTTNNINSAITPGESIIIDTPIEWKYAITNTGTFDIANITLNDDQEGTIACSKDILTPDESMECTKTGTAKVGQYQNIATVTGTDIEDNEIEETATNYYFGVEFIPTPTPTSTPELTPTPTLNPEITPTPIPEVILTPIPTSTPRPTPIPLPDPKIKSIQAICNSIELEVSTQGEYQKEKLDFKVNSKNIDSGKEEEIKFKNIKTNSHGRVTLKLESLEQNTAYQIKVRYKAEDDGDYSDWSKKEEAKTLKCISSIISTPMLKSSPIPFLAPTPIPTIIPSPTFNPSSAPDVIISKNEQNGKTIFLRLVGEFLDAQGLIRILFLLLIILLIVLIILLGWRKMREKR